MSVILMRLAGAMQSWGTKSRFYDRDTEEFPSKSGVLGIICAALGRDRSEDLSDLNTLKIGVRIIDPGIRTYDYQVAGVDGYYRASGSVERNSAIPYTKNYLSSADFLVALEGDKELLLEIDNALRCPVYPLFLGRKSYVASKPIFTDCGIIDKPIFNALKEFQFNTIIDSDIIYKIKRKFYNQGKFDDKKEYSQTFVFDSDIEVVGLMPALITMVQDEPINFLSRQYLLREIKFYNVKFDEPKIYFSSFIAGGSDVLE